MGHFSTCLKHISPNKHKTLEKRYASQIYLLMKEFTKRFVLSKDEKPQLTLIEDPFFVNPGEISIFDSWGLLDYNVQYSIKENRVISLQDFYKSQNYKSNMNVIEVVLKHFAYLVAHTQCDN